MKLRFLLITFVVLFYSLNIFAWNNGGVLIQTNNLTTDDGRYFIYFNYYAVVYDVDSQKVANQWVFPHDTYVNFAVNSDKHLLAVIDYDSRPKPRLTVFNFLTSELLLKVDSVSICGNLAFADSGNAVIYFDTFQNTISKWQLDSKERIYDSLKSIDIRSPFSALSHDGTKMCYTKSESLILIDVRKDSVLSKIKLKSKIISLQHGPHFYNSNLKFGKTNNIIAFVDSLNFIRSLNTENNLYLVEFPLDSDYTYFKNFTFSSKDNYLTVNNFNSTKVWQIQGGNEMELTKLKNKNISCISDDGLRAIEIKSDYYRCGLYDEIPFPSYYYNFFTIDNDSVITSIPEGYCGSDSISVLTSSDGEYMASYGAKRFGMPDNSIYITITGLNDNKIIKSTQVTGVPASFSSDSRFLILIDSSKFSFYDFLKNKNMDSIQTDMKTISNLSVCSSKNLIICHNSTIAEIFDLNNFELKAKFDYSDSNKIIQFCRMNPQGILSIITNDNKLLKYDYNTNSITNFDLKFLKEYSGTPMDMSGDDRYLLFSKKSKWFEYNFVWDLENDKQLFVDSAYYGYGNRRSFSGFIIPPYSIYVTTIWGDYNLEHNTFLINLKSGVKIESDQYINFSVAPDSLHFVAGGCPGIYYYEQIPPELLTDVGVNDFSRSSGKITLFPNPAAYRLTVTVPNAAASQIAVYNLQGESVEAPALPNANGYDITTSGLPAGMYFVRITCGDKVVSKGFAVGR